jgi:hypothetical protein
LIWIFQLLSARTDSAVREILATSVSISDLMTMTEHIEDVYTHVTATTAMVQEILLEILS